jgi:hypothetical protein
VAFSVTWLFSHQALHFTTFMVFGAAGAVAFIAFFVADMALGN